MLLDAQGAIGDWTPCLAEKASDARDQLQLIFNQHEMLKVFKQNVNLPKAICILSVQESRDLNFSSAKASKMTSNFLAKFIHVNSRAQDYNI